MKMEKSKFKFTERYIQDKLEGFFAEGTKKYVLENLHVFKWESDKLIETKSGLIYEFEAKVTKSDFKNDFKHKQDKHVILEGKEKYLPSYEEDKKMYPHLDGKYYLAEHYKKPNFFYYAVPENMISAEDVPDYAGLIYILPNDGEFHYSYIKVIKTAPKLHGTKYTDDELKLGEKFYYNMLSWKNKYLSEKEKQLLAEGQDHEIPYSDLLDKYNKAKSEIKGSKTIIKSCDEQIRLQMDNLNEYHRIIRAYRNKIKEFDKDFNVLDFEYNALKEK